MQCNIKVQLIFEKIVLGYTLQMFTVVILKMLWNNQQTGISICQTDTVNDLAFDNQVTFKLLLDSTWI